MTQDLATQALAAPPAIIPPAHSRADDLRSFSMMLPIEDQQRMLSEYKERRDFFRHWLLSQLIEGLHFGYAPGCEPKTKVINGVLHVGQWNPKAKAGAGDMQWYPETQWKPKPGFYAAGADFVCDTLRVRDEYEADEAASRQLGYDKGDKRAFIYKCKLYSRNNGEFLGEGIGARLLGWRGGDVNNSIKMACKNAKTCAVMNVYGLRDLFVQEQDQEAELHDNPEHDATAPAVATRGQRIDAAAVSAQAERWKRRLQPEDATEGEWFRWVKQVCGEDFEVGKSSQWTHERLAKVRAAIDREEGK